MKQLSIEDLRALIRLIPAAQALRDELDRSIHLETFEGTGRLAARSFVGLQRSVLSLTEDPYVDALSLELSEDMSERVVISQVLLAASQLLAYMEGQAGITGLTGKRDYRVQTAPTITLNMDGFQGGPMEMGRIMETIDRAMHFHPVVPPAPPTPPMPMSPPLPGAPASPNFPGRGTPQPPHHWHEDDEE
jgi:hypothetical protein